MVLKAISNAASWVSSRVWSTITYVISSFWQKRNVSLTLSGGAKQTAAKAQDLFNRAIEKMVEKKHLQPNIKDDIKDKYSRLNDDSFGKYIDSLVNKGITGPNAWFIKNCSLAAQGKQLDQKAYNSLKKHGYDFLFQENDIGLLRKRLANVYQETLKIAQSSYYIYQGSIVKFSSSDRQYMQANTALIKPRQISKNPCADPFQATAPVSFSIVQDDCIETAIALKNKGFNPLVLNMANAHKPGGGVENGARAQEESICRRTDIMLALDPKMNHYLTRQMPNGYFIPDDHVILVPSVQVFREPESKALEFKQQPVKLDFVACAALSIQKGTRLDQTQGEMTKEKIRNILRTAVMNGNDSVVLSALGCGAFNNPPDQVANLFKQVLSEPEFTGGVFKGIFFAIINDHNGSQNFQIFQNILTS